jgi:hypothetical protein
VVLKDGVTRIGDKTFYYCTELTSVTIPDSVMSIGNLAFYKTAIYNNNSNWENGALYIDKFLIRVSAVAINSDCTIKNGTKVIADNAFEANYVLTSVTIPDSVTSIGDRAFYSCESLENVIIPDGVTYIGEEAFYCCENLKSITIGKGVSFIGDYALGFKEIGSIEGFTVIGHCGSVAETYAKYHGFVFIPIDGITAPESDYYLDNILNTMPNVVADTTVEAIISRLSLYGITTTITDESGNRLDVSSKVGTGCKVTDHNGNAYTVIVKGDVDGNGNVDTTDYLKIKSAFLGALDLNETYFKAADVDGSSNIDTTDYLKIKNHFLGTCNLYS